MNDTHYPPMEADALTEQEFTYSCAAHAASGEQAAVAFGTLHQQYKMRYYVVYSQTTLAGNTEETHLLVYGGVKVRYFVKNGYIAGMKTDVEDAAQEKKSGE